MADMPPMNVRRTLEHIAHVGTGYLKPAYSRDDMDAWLRNHAIAVRRLEDLLDVEMLTAADAHAAGWGDFSDKVEHHHGGNLVMRLRDGRLGGADSSNDTSREMWAVAHEHVCAFLLGRVTSRAVPKAAHLPDLARSVLAHEGIDVDAAERLAVLIGRMTLTINGRHHGADMSLPRREHDAFMKRHAKGDYALIDTAELAWSKIKVMVSKSPAVHVLDGKVTARVILPDLIANTLPGRPLTDVFDHPAFVGQTIKGAVQRPSGFTLKLA